VANKLYLNLLLKGENSLASQIELLFSLAQKAYEIILSDDEFQSPIKPICNIILFNLRGAPEKSRSIYQMILQDGTFHITFAEFKGKEYLRCAFMNPKTTCEHFIDLLTKIKKLK